MANTRMSGILLHPSSLPGPEGCGTFGREARMFVDFLAAAGQSIWQVLPLGPPGYGHSPYSCYSAFAGNPMLIDMEQLREEGDVASGEVPDIQFSDRIDFTVVSDKKMVLLRNAAQRFHETADLQRKQEFWAFCDNTFWLHDYALFMSCKDHFHGKGWNKWPVELVSRSRQGCDRYSEKLGRAIGEHKYIQWQFFRQWRVLRDYANNKGVRIIGDAPIFVAYDSADVWCNQHLFQLDESGKPTVVAGVPPDYFSKTGQRWGNPLYNWERLAEDGYGWWIARLKSDLGMYNLLRIDHFRGFEANWEIPSREKTAIKGRWVKGPGERFFHAAQTALGQLPLIAEDLGVITPEVEMLRDRFGLPGMKILQFAFDSGPDNAYLPHNHAANCVVYTGTHDNDTSRGWFSGLPEGMKRRVLWYLRCTERDVVWEMIRAAWSSVGRTAIIPVQDLLGLDGSARMNIPGVADGNWGWRFRSGLLDDKLGLRLLDLTETYNRRVR